MVKIDIVTVPIFVAPHQKEEDKDKERDRISRLLMYLNDALAMENAAVERLQERTKETDNEELKMAIQKHYQSEFFL